VESLSDAGLQLGVLRDPKLRLLTLLLALLELLELLELELSSKAVDGLTL
jgi:hypothetical protein